MIDVVKSHISFLVFLSHHELVLLLGIGTKTMDFLSLAIVLVTVKKY